MTGLGLGLGLVPRAEAVAAMLRSQVRCASICEDAKSILSRDGGYTLTQRALIHRLAMKYSHFSTSERAAIDRAFD